MFPNGLLPVAEFGGGNGRARGIARTGITPSIAMLDTPHRGVKDAAVVLPHSLFRLQKELGGPP